MDFNQLLARMQELDSPALEGTTEGCGMMPPAPAPTKPEPPAPNMSINVNAQGMDNIESMLSLIAKLSGAGKTDMPSMSPMPAIMPLDRMIPDMDGDNDNKVGGEMDLPKDHDKDHMIVKTLDKDDDGDHDMDDHEKEAAPAGAALGAAGKALKGAPTPKPGAAAAGASLGAAAKAAGSAMGTGVAAGAAKGASGIAGAAQGAMTGAAKGATKAQPPGVGMKANAPDADDDGKLGMGKNVDPKQIKIDDIDLGALMQLAGQESKLADAYANEPDEMRRDSDYMNNKLAGGMNRPKDTHPKVSDGDNPMNRVKEGNDLRAQIHAELTAKLAEFMGAK